MENYQQLTELIKEKERVDEYVKRIKSLQFYGQYGTFTVIRIGQHENDRYNFSKLGEIIGQQKLNELLRQFEGLISVELFRVQQELAGQLDAYKVVKH